MFICHEKTADEAEEANENNCADVEVVLPVSGAARGVRGIKAYELAGGSMAKVVHKGPYESCGPAYKKLFGWVSSNGKIVSGPVRELYANDPSQVKPEDIITEIYAPIG
jgi:effector-binding domain-containing protein